MHAHDPAHPAPRGACVLAMDPLTLLREFTIGKRPVEEDGDFLVFDDVKFEKSANTNYRLGSDNYLRLDVAWFFAKTFASNPNASFADYVKESRERGLPWVSGVDRRDLLAYLTGEASTSAKIDPIAPTATAVPVAKGRARAGRPDAAGAPVAG